MADKTANAAAGSPIDAGNVTTNGSIAADSLAVVFDDTTPCATVIDLLRKCEADIIGYYAKR